ncbi:hypothetical protein BFW38_07270 [Terasakiispira papahanaumokuakeensis]|uniref:AI-2E family transporter n=1 Tax=Terasakiispira papahanaumokuakeensis TaxID=197479 RepID=A0A1E2V8S2_9GAMM|nr:hypothetical protein [Terasakiispira papahanaumokuakeensis]ODC03377.1 hypothetical protein BFW38_07270 [Terasakiispira papahanaumokuakeensis]
MIKFISWLMTSVLLLAGLWFSQFYLLSGLMLILVGLIWWPPTRHYALHRWQLPHMPLLHVGVSLCLLVVALFAFIGQYQQTLLTQAQQAGFSTVEQWRQAQEEAESAASMTSKTEHSTKQPSE